MGKYFIDSGELKSESTAMYNLDYINEIFGFGKKKKKHSDFLPLTEKEVSDSVNYSKKVIGKYPQLFKKTEFASKEEISKELNNSKISAGYEYIKVFTIDSGSEDGFSSKEDKMTDDIATLMFDYAEKNGSFRFVETSRFGMYELSICSTKKANQPDGDSK